MLGAVLGVVVVALAATVFYTLPRSNAFTGVLEENLVLKERLNTLDQKMLEVDRMMLRLRLYDAQLRSLSEPKGDHGPVSMDPEDLRITFANAGLDEKVLDEYVIDDEGREVGSAVEWVDLIEERADNFLHRMERTEPNLNEMMVELEDLRALEAALPESWPTKGMLSSGYGWRKDPVAKAGHRFHSGLDIAAARGTTIRAAAAGEVIRAEYNSGYGRVLEIRHGYGITTLYAHCHRLRVKKGDRVKAGQKIATMGSTGQSTGPHLHFEVRLDGNAVDPLDYLRRGQAQK